MRVLSSPIHYKVAWSAQEKETNRVAQACNRGIVIPIHFELRYQAFIVSSTPFSAATNGDQNSAIPPRPIPVMGHNLTLKMK